MAEQEEQRADRELRCDTCGCVTETVRRVVVDSGYNRANSRPIFNCPDCFERKLATRAGKRGGDG